jgi:hypothetical protein
MFNPYFFKSSVFVSHITIQGVKICRYVYVELNVIIIIMTLFSWLFGWDLSVS